MTPEDFFVLVTRMRKEQKDYFRTYSSYYLKRAKDLEKQVDNEIERVAEIAKLKNLEIQKKLDFKF